MTEALHTPFLVSLQTLQTLAETRDLHPLVRDIGGVHGLEKALCVNAQLGVDAEDSSSDDSVKPSLDDRRAVFGCNKIPPVSDPTFLELVWEALHDKTLIVLSVAATISLAIGIYKDVQLGQNGQPSSEQINWIEGVAIVIAIVVVVTVSSVNDMKKAKQYRALHSKKEDRMIKVRRSGHERLISVYDLVVGDVCFLEPGDICPGDGIMIESYNLCCDESDATGESDTVRKKPLPESIQTDAPLERLDPFILSGSKVTEGSGLMIVIAVGPYSLHGRTMLGLQVAPMDTPLQIKLNALAETIAKSGVIVALLTFISLLLKFFVREASLTMTDDAATIFSDIMTILIQAVTIVVVAVPEGLPMAVALALDYATTHMLKDQNLVRVSAACETMGRATTICSDKTGTLTQNKMTVVEGYFACKRYHQMDELQQLKDKVSPSLLSLLFEAISVNSTAFASSDEPKTIIGNKTESALLQFADSNGCDWEKLRASHKVVQVFPFASERKSMTTLIDMTHCDSTPSLHEPNATVRAHVKGASEIVLAMCDSYVDEQGAVRPLDNMTRHLIHDQINLYASHALRTLVLAYREAAEMDDLIEQEDEPLHRPPSDPLIATLEAEMASSPPESVIVLHPPRQHLTFIGLVGIEDPLRPGVIEAVQTCLKAGVSVRMVTGDNTETARAIAQRSGILTRGGLVLDGPHFRCLNKPDMMRLLPRLQVLARSSPTDKQLLVMRLRELGEIVAVTGDGTNDGPALKAAHVGFSMGIAGTEVAKEASSIIIMDDSFASIVKAISWGRCVNDSVRKFLQFQLTVNFSAVILAFVTAVSDSLGESVLRSTQLLWINMIMNTMGALALATDPPSPDLLERKPDRPNRRLITFRMWMMILGQAIYQIVLCLVLFYQGYSIFGYDPVEDRLRLRSLIFNAFVFMQIFNEINSRRIDTQINVFRGMFRNATFMIVLGVTLTGQLLITLVPSVGVAFDVVPLYEAREWIFCLLAGSFSLVIGLIVRLVPTFKFRRLPSIVMNSVDQVDVETGAVDESSDHGRLSNASSQDLRIFTAVRRAPNGLVRQNVSAHVSHSEGRNSFEMSFLANVAKD